VQDIDIQGLNVPALGFGTWELSGRAAYEGTRTALDLGYRHIDRAQITATRPRLAARSAIAASAVLRRFWAGAL